MSEPNDISKMQIFSSEGFIPHGHCYLWKTELVWLHIVSDASIALAYYSIPIALIYFVRKRKDLPFNWIFWLFGAFIATCGTTHLMEIWTLWHPTYWLSGLLKAITAFVSSYTTLALIPLLPKALALPSPAQLEKANKELEHEIIERKLAEEALRESEERFRGLVNSAPVGIFQTDLLGDCLFVNSRWLEIAQLSREEALGTGWEKAIHPDDRLSVFTEWYDAAATGREFAMECRFLTPQGQVKWIFVTAVPLRDCSGAITGYLGSVKDISDRKRAEEALQQSEAREREKAKELELTLDELKRTQGQLIQAEKMSSLGQMVAGIAHEINNPVGFIYTNIFPAAAYVQDLINLVELYQQHYPNPVTEIAEQIENVEPDFIKEDFPKLLASMKEGADRISQIVGSLRNFSRLDEAQCKQVDIHEGIENTLFILQHRLKSQPRRSKIQIIREYGQLPMVECYPGELNQVFMNILCNTIDALDEFAINAHLSAVSEKSNNNEQITTEFRPMIRICTNVANDSRVVIRIADNGGGIRAEVVPKIFDPFFTTKPPGKGTGLGLFICYQIVVDKHGGELTCHSVPGQGTELMIELPIVQAKKLDSYLEKSSQIASLLGTGDKL